jgi:hypothetical protein
MVAKAGFAMKIGFGQQPVRYENWIWATARQDLTPLLSLWFSAKSLISKCLRYRT